MAAVLDNQTQRWKETIDGQNYEFGRWGASLALRTMLQLSGIIGAPLANMGLAAVSQARNGRKALQNSDVISQLAAQMGQHGDEAVRLLKQFAGTEGDVLRGGKRIDFDRDYQGKLGHMLRVARANYEVQYGPLDKLGDSLSELLGAAPASPSPTDTGTAAP